MADIMAHNDEGGDGNGPGDRAHHMEMINLHHASMKYHIQKLSGEQDEHLGEGQADRGNSIKGDDYGDTEAYAGKESPIEEQEEARNPLPTNRRGRRR